MTVRRLLGALPLLGLIAGPAMAADMPVKAPVYKARPPVAAFNWTGFYLGGNLGYSWGRSNNDENFFAPGANPPGNTTCPVAEPASNFSAFCAANSDRNRLNGVIGGVETGYNWQTGSYMVGVETDFQLSGQKGSQNLNSSVATGNTIQFSGGPIIPIVSTLAAAYTQKLDWLGTLRGRLGFVQDRWLVFATGGLAYGQVKDVGTASATGTASVSGIPLADCLAAGCPVLPFGNWSDTQTRVGWTLGVGAERAIMGNWSWKVEYLHVDLGKVHTTFATLPGCYGNIVFGPGAGFAAACIPVTAGTGTISGRMTDEIVRIGINYRFDGTVVAKY
jgi:outer membrane immunogenic protein